MKSEAKVVAGLTLFSISHSLLEKRQFEIRLARSCWYQRSSAQRRFCLGLSKILPGRSIAFRLDFIRCCSIGFGQREFQRKGTEDVTLSHLRLDDLIVFTEPITKLKIELSFVSGSMPLLLVNRSCRRHTQTIEQCAFARHELHSHTHIPPFKHTILPRLPTLF